MTPHNPGDRVVAPHPSGRPVVGTVSEVLHDGDVMVRCGDGAFRASASEVRPAMPRDRGDLDKYGPHWWCRGAPVYVAALDGDLEPMRFWRGAESGVPLRHGFDWRGPVEPPPEVRS